MGKKTSTSAAKAMARENASLALQNGLLAKRSALLQSTIENSLGGLVQGLGAGQTNLTSMNPALQNNMYAPVTLMYAMLMYMYKTHGLIQTAIDQPVLDSMRGGLELLSDEMDQDDLSEIEDFLEENGVLERVADAFIWARLFGGGALIINTEGKSSEEIGDEVHGGKIEFYDACRWELQCDRRIPSNDGLYGFYAQQLHPSRVLTITGKRAPFLIRAQLSDWGMSEIERMMEDFNSYIRGKNVIYELLDEAKIDVYSMKGFAAQLATSNGTALTTRRIQAMNQIKNFNSALILDKDDSYEQKQLGFSGLAEIMKENRIGIASALRMPMSKLFGIGSTGFSSGEDDIENYNALVESEVRQPMKQIIRKVLRIVVRHLHGEELDIRFKFRPLRTLTADAEETIKSSKTTRFLSLYDKLLINSREMGEMLAKENLTPIQLEAEQGLLDEHPVSAEGQVQGQPGLNVDAEDEDGLEDEKAAPAKASKKDDKKPPKAEKPEKPEKAV